MTSHPTSDQSTVLDAIRETAKALGRAPSRREFMRSSGMTEYQVLRHFPSWREAVRAAGLDSEPTNVPLEPAVLLEDWGELVRRARRIPTRHQYRRDGSYSPGVFERKFGPWSAVPAKFREFAANRPEWVDVVALLPIENRFSAASGVTDSLSIRRLILPATPPHQARESTHVREPDRLSWLAT